ncbi:MAG: hypothetical protein PHW35_13515 [Lentimicrobiaceae bacterium]|jgi:hypothetical protein|nr:hypothetical protein [Lentimicrobiaceae bacterium]MDD4598978.1 hypothetical protein [Lentimicrobiaceae bacterium]
MKTKTILLILALAVGIFNACKKDHAPAIDPPSEAGNDKINQLLGNFTDNYETFKSGKWLKSGDKIDYDSVLWYIDGAINFNYASGQYAFEKIHKDTIYVEVAVDADMKSLFANVFESYGESLIRIGEKYYELTGEYKKFVMATVSDAGPLADGKRKLRIATITGTGFASQNGDFGNDENYLYNTDAEVNCDGELASGAPVIFEAMLLAHFNPEPTNGSRYYFVGTPTIVEYDYKDYKIDSSALLTNYLDYKIYAAHEIFEFTDEVLCLEYNQNNSGIHEMQFYYDHLKDLANIWLSQQGNVTIRKSFAPSEIKSPMDGDSPNRVIYHFPKFHFRIKVATHEPSTPYFPTE